MQRSETAVDHAQFMQNLINPHYPGARRIRLVQDNLNTHTPGSFYEVLPPQKAFELSQKFETHHTPKKGSWLNMAEIEFSAISKQCLNRRIPDAETLQKEVLAWVDDRNSQRKSVDWKFSKTNARIKLERHYSNVQKLI
jgi:DDE superfamily endonuclease